MKQKIINLLRKKIHKKVRIELWFLILLIFLTVSVFLLTEYYATKIFRKTAQVIYEVQTEDEKKAYSPTLHDIKEDIVFLFKSRGKRPESGPENVAGPDTQMIAVIVENYTPIRGTEEGLDEAEIVYETLAEGGITRLLLIFGGNDSDPIGPIRSARPYFVTWASEYRAPLAHVGGSPDALEMLKTNTEVFNIDEFFDYKTIWRIKKYYAPHNAFTSTFKIKERLEKDGYEKLMEKERFDYKKPDKDRGDIKNITIDFSIFPYQVKYEYDTEDNLYARYNGGKRHGEIKPANIIVQFVDYEVLDNIGRLWIQTHGTGNALVFRDGKAIEGYWSKDDTINSDDQKMSQTWTKFFDDEGNEIKLNRGQTWIEAVPDDRSVNYF